MNHRGKHVGFTRQGDVNHLIFVIIKRHEIRDKKKKRHIIIIIRINKRKKRKKNNKEIDKSKLKKGGKTKRKILLGQKYETM